MSNKRLERLLELLLAHWFNRSSDWFNWLKFNLDWPDLLRLGGSGLALNRLNRSWLGLNSRYWSRLDRLNRSWLTLQRLNRSGLSRNRLNRSCWPLSHLEPTGSGLNESRSCDFIQSQLEINVGCCRLLSNRTLLLGCSNELTGVKQDYRGLVRESGRYTYTWSCSWHRCSSGW